MEAWRRVEVAAGEELGAARRAWPERQELEAISGAGFTVEEVDEREAETDHDVAAFVDVLAPRRVRRVAGSTSG